MRARAMPRFAVLGLALAFPLAAAPANPPAAGESAPGGVMTGKNPAKTDAAGKITDPKHPDFVRCRSEPVLNSRAVRVGVCRTNKQWTAAGRESNRQAQELLNLGRPLQPTP